jgi:hypothetical protein
VAQIVEMTQWPPAVPGNQAMYIIGQQCEEKEKRRKLKNTNRRIKYVAKSSGKAGLSLHTEIQPSFAQHFST